jgi:hypothetical protein
MAVPDLPQVWTHQNGAIYVRRNPGRRDRSRRVIAWLLTILTTAYVLAGVFNPSLLADVAAGEAMRVVGPVLIGGAILHLVVVESGLRRAYAEIRHETVRLLGWKITRTRIEGVRIGKARPDEVPTLLLGIRDGQPAPWLPLVEPGRLDRDELKALQVAVTDLLQLDTK